MDHRRASRIPVDLPARYRSDDFFLDGRAMNLSQDGMLLATDFVALPVGRRAFLEVDLPDLESPLHAVGEICWSDVASVGIRFMELSLPDFRRLANFVLRRAAF